MAGPSEPLRVLAAAAHAAVAPVLRNPALSSVLVDLIERRSRLEPARLQFAFLYEWRLGAEAGSLLEGNA